MNAYCSTLGIEVPRLESFNSNREVNTYQRLIIALLERGEPMTLIDVAERFEQADVADFDRALLSLQRCKPARAPVVRDGEMYSLDVLDREMELWLLRLGLRPRPKARPAPELPPVPGPDQQLTVVELDTAWRSAYLGSWADARLVLSVLDAHGEPLEPEAVRDFVASRAAHHRLDRELKSFHRRGSSVGVLADGRLAIAEGADDAVRKARIAVRELMRRNQRDAAMRTPPEVIEQSRREWEAQREDRRARLAIERRAILYAYPRTKPRALALLDVAARTIETFVEGEIDSIGARLESFEWIGAMEARPLLRALGFEHGERRLVELGPPQKSRQLNKQGRKLAISNELLISSSCGISRAFGDERKLADYLRDGDDTKLRRRLESSVKHLFAFYEYGRLHGCVRLRWGFLDETITAPWCELLDEGLHELKKQALKRRVPLEVVVGSAPGWADPWSRAIVAYVDGKAGSWHDNLVTEHGEPIDDRLVQSARLLGVADALVSSQPVIDAQRMHGGAAPTTSRAVKSPQLPRPKLPSLSPSAPRCGLCGKTENLTKTSCCGNWICDDAHTYRMHSFARNSCWMNHARQTLCAVHHAAKHEGRWQDCAKCRAEYDAESYAEFGTNEYNFEKLENPPSFELKRCSECGRPIVQKEGGYSQLGDQFTCKNCLPEKLRKMLERLQ